MNTGKMWFLVVSLFAFSLLGALVVPLGLPESIALPRAVAQGPNTPTPTPTNTPTPTPTVMPCPDKVTETRHFAIEWCNNPSDPAYPPAGFTYIRVLSDSLEAAWDTISGPLGYEMPVLDAPVRNIVPNLVYAASGHEVKTVMVAGRVLVRDGQVLTADEAAVRADAQAQRVAADPVHKGMALLEAMEAGRL